VSTGPDAEAELEWIKEHSRNAEVLSGWEWIKAHSQPADD
jgi:hypothetical protein